MKTIKKVRINWTLLSTTVDKLKKIAKKQGVSMSALIDELIKQKK